MNINFNYGYAFYFADDPEKILRSNYIDLSSKSGLSIPIRENFTGSLDIKGNEIYVGDILKGHTFKEPIIRKTKKEIIGECIILKNGEFTFYAELEKLYRTYPHISSCEIIDNIYETPELLK